MSDACTNHILAILHLSAAHGDIFSFSLLDIQVKMVTADDESVTDILCEGPEEEIERFRKELGLFEKGKELVKGLLER